MSWVESGGRLLQKRSGESASETRIANMVQKVMAMERSPHGAER